MSSMVKLLLTFSLTVGLEGVHPLQSGVIRLRHPSERRPGLPRELAWIFWPRLAWDTVHKTFVTLSRLSELSIDAIKAVRDPERDNYMDQALTPVHDDDDETLDLTTKTGGARAAVAHIQRVDKLTHGFGVAAGHEP